MSVLDTKTPTLLVLGLGEQYCYMILNIYFGTSLLFFLSRDLNCNIGVIVSKKTVLVPKLDKQTFYSY